MKYWVYVHIFPNGKRYVGITTMDSPEKRWKNGEGYNRQIVYRAIKKFGWNNVSHEVFEVDSEEEMCKKEIELIALYNSDNPSFGYNIDPGGTHATHPEEIRKKISEKNKGQIRSEETRKKLSEAHKGKVAWNKGKEMSEEFKQKCSNSHKGKAKPWLKGKSRPHTEEWKQKMSEKMKGRSSEWLKGSHRSEESKRKTSETLRGRPKTKFKYTLPDGSIQILNATKAYYTYTVKGIQIEKGPRVI